MHNFESNTAMIHCSHDKHSVLYNDVRHNCNCIINTLYSLKFKLSKLRYLHIT